MAGAKRPGFPTNVGANTQALKGESKFISIKEDGSELLRFLPAPREDGMIFYPTTNHYGVVNQDKKKMALGCLAVHGTEETGKRCLMCAVNAYFAENFESLGFSEDEAKAVRPNTRFYAQVLGANVSNGKITGWSKPSLIHFSQTAANTIATIFQNQEKFGQPVATDPDKGQGIIVSRSGKGFQTKYAAERDSMPVSLDEIRPTWVDEFMSDIYKEIGLNVVSPKVQLAYLRVSYPSLDWDSIVEAVGFADLVAAE